MQRLTFEAFRGLFVLLSLTAALIFGAAGTLHYASAWLFLAVFSGANVAITLALLRRDPDLLARRLRGGPTAESRRAQRLIMSGASVGYAVLFVVPGLDHRFGWSTPPAYLPVLGNSLVALGFLGIHFVFVANSFAAATVTLAADQRVVTTGPYSIVRHPMYACGLLMLAGVPPALGSVWGLLAFLILLPGILWRLTDEEQLLLRELPGYAQYRLQVPWRLVPRLW